MLDLVEMFEPKNEDGRQLFSLNNLEVYENIRDTTCQLVREILYMFQSMNEGGTHSDG
jgi:hypothetical protein